MWIKIKTSLLFSLIFILSLSHFLGLTAESLGRPQLSHFLSVQKKSSSHQAPWQLASDHQDLPPYLTGFDPESNDQEELERAQNKQATLIQLYFELLPSPKHQDHFERTHVTLKYYSQSPFDARLYSCLNKIHSSLSPPLWSIS